MGAVVLLVVLLAVCLLAPFAGADSRPDPDDRRPWWPGHAPERPLAPRARLLHLPLPAPDAEGGLATPAVERAAARPLRLRPGMRTSPPGRRIAGGPR